MAKKSTAGQNYASWTLTRYFDEIFEPLRMLGKSPRTSVLYRMTIARLSEFLGREAKLGDLVDATVSKFLRSRIAQGRAEHTVDKERDKIISLANYAARKRHLEEFLQIPTLNPSTAAPQCWKPDQLAALLKACATSQGRIGAVSAAGYWLAFHYVVLYTGERTEAMLHLRWDWLDLSSGWLRVPAAVRKGRKKPMNYRLPTIAVDKLRAIEEPRRERIFEGFGCVETFYIHYAKLLTRAGLPTGRSYKPQALRRTFASFLEAAGGDATRALAHSSRRVTEESYLDETIINREPSSEILGRVLRLPGFVARDANLSRIAEIPAIEFTPQELKDADDTVLTEVDGISSQTRLCDFVDYYGAERKLSVVSISRLHFCERALSRSLGRGALVGDLSAASISEFSANYLKNRTRATVRHYVWGLRTLTRALVSLRLLPHQPSLRTICMEVAAHG